MLNFYEYHLSLGYRAKNEISQSVCGLHVFFLSLIALLTVS